MSQPEVQAEVQAQLKQHMTRFFAEIKAAEPDRPDTEIIALAFERAKAAMAPTANTELAQHAQVDSDPMQVVEAEPAEMSVTNESKDSDTMDTAPTLIIPAGVVTIDHNSITRLLDKARADKDYKPLVRQLGAVFRDSRSLNFSFLESSPRPDVGALRDAYQKLLRASQEAPEITNALDNAIEGLACNLQYFQGAEQLRPEWINQFLIILEYPRLSEFCTENPTLLFQLFKIIASLPQNLHDELMSRWGSSEEEFQRFFSMIMMAITVKLMMIQGYREAFSQVAPAVQMLELLYKVNEEKGFVPINEFYNDGVNESVDLKQDFISWRQLREDPELRKKSHEKTVKDSFCDFPFILSPASKARIMQLDAGLQQNERYRDAMLSNMLGGGQRGQQIPFLVLRVNRDRMVEDTMTQIAGSEPQDLKKPLKVQFVGEEAVDEGGVQKEFFLLMVRQLLDPQYAMFKVDEDARTMWFNGFSYECKMQFELIGVLMGVAIYNSVILDVHFPPVLYKRLMGLSPSLEDLKEAMPSLASGLEKLLTFDGDVEECFGQTFEVTQDVFGEKKHTELKPGGSKINVTNANRQEYVDLRVEFELVKSVEVQFSAFESGFKKVCGGDALELFRPDELELLICGNPELDFDALEEAAHYEDGFTKDDPVIKNLWKVIHALSMDDKKKFLMFVTGSDRSPVGGLSTLHLVISRNGPDSDRLPTSHTCFNHLLLPEYSSAEKLQERLSVAINHSEGFGTQ